ncbi:cation:proton antiporter domain-containing protein [Yoonia sp. 208BN28-4]|uniref:cation:proton antiporter domain-containing protein n=1 Tax=Yoonia sp. 208BN28-4 TaxID=3126505 RepID=UPI0030B333E2
MTGFLLLSFIFLIAGVIAVPIATRLGLGSVLGYLIAGIAISPILSVLGVDVVSIQHFAEFGVVMMLFLVGLELEPKLLWSMRAKLLGLGGGQVVVTTLAVMGIALLFGLEWTVALAIGLVLALSSTAIVLQTLNEKGLMKSDGGQSAFSVLLTQDIAVIPMLALIPLLAMPEIVGDVADTAAQAADGHGAESHSNDDHGGDEHGESMSLVDGLSGWQTALVTLAAIAAVVLGGNFLIGPIFRFIAAANLRELFTATALMIVIGIALLMSLVGLSPALGTFVAGVVLANSAYRHELESDIDPFKGLLLGLFFMTVGAGINFALLFDNLLLIVALTLGLIALKAAILYVLALCFNITGADRWLFTLGLAQAGEFGFVLLSFTVASNVIPTALADQLLLVVALSMLLTPALFILFDRVIAPRFNADDDRPMDTIDEQSQIIIAGHGRVGGLVSRILKGAGHAPTVIDFSAKQLEMLEKFGVRAYYGDATRPDMLHSAGMDEAKMLVIAIDGKDQITDLVKYVLHTYPDVHVVARAVDRNHVYDLWAAGCRDIIRDYYDSSLRMGRSALEALGNPRDQAQRMVDAFNDLDGKAMLDLAEHYSTDIAATENEAYMSKVREMVDVWEDDLKSRMSKIMQDAKD